MGAPEEESIWEVALRKFRERLPPGVTITVSPIDREGNFPMVVMVDFGGGVTLTVPAESEVVLHWAPGEGQRLFRWSE